MFVSNCCLVGMYGASTMYSNNVCFKRYERDLPDSDYKKRLLRGKQSREDESRVYDDYSKS